MFGTDADLVGRYIDKTRRQQGRRGYKTPRAELGEANGIYEVSGDPDGPDQAG